MCIWTAPKRPMIRALRLVDREISNGCKAKSHQIIIVELPILIAVRAKPVSRIVMRFVSKAHGNAIFVVSPKLLDQSKIELFRPLAGQKSLPEKLRARESPNDRRNLSQSVFEGPFKPD
jgi:hypothetical protein